MEFVTAHDVIKRYRNFSSFNLHVWMSKQVEINILNALFLYLIVPRLWNSLPEELQNFK
jgi:hypothetical protein